jgi:hypothetical protein
VEGSSEHGNAPSGALKFSDIPEQLSEGLSRAQNGVGNLVKGKVIIMCLAN